MITRILFLIVAACLLSPCIFGQKQLHNGVQVTCEKNNTGDTIWLTVKRSRDQKPGTLFITAFHAKAGITDTLFFPIVDTLSFFALTIPDAYQQGKLTLTGLFYPKIFEVSGMVLNKLKDLTVKVLLITKNQKIYNKELKLNDDRQFTLPGLIFENKASLIFNYSIANKKEKPNIIIQQDPALKNFTDTIFSKVIALSEERYVDTVQSIIPNKNLPITDKNDRSKLLKEVVVTGTKKSKAEKYNDENTTSLFNESDEVLIDCLENNNILSYTDCFSFLRSQVPGLTVSMDNFGENVLRWRGKEIKAFYIDEIEVDLDQISNTPVGDIAIIKAFPPPFFGAMGNGDGGAIALYLRKGEYRRESNIDNKWLFSIKGYSPAVHILFDKK